MTDYNLAGLGTRSFEQLIQALSADVIGPNIIVFGDGPDGAREATFDGPIPYPNVVAPWNGYGVIQAKFLQRPTNPSRDGQWVLDQLAEELRKFLDKKRKLPKPEYYILATNVVLTAVAGRGAKDKVASLIKSYQEKIGLKDFDIWDFDKIRTFLDNNRDVATSYGAWITAGDVLSKIVSQLGIQQPKFDHVIANFLQKELMSDQYANLQQAGHATKDPIPLSAVFTDLVASERRLYEPDQEKVPLAPGFIDEVLKASVVKFDPDSLASTAGSGSQRTANQGRRAGKYVLIGGPGQGKTTIGQYLCQLFRVAILQDRTRLSSGVKGAIEQIRKQSLADKLQLPSVRRFPIRVVLSEFAKALAQSKGTTSLLTYISNRICERTNHHVEVADFRQWMAAYPWLLILDGLDEVPASSNRDQVMTAINDFGVDATESNADILTIATTRPQGYSNEFSPEFYFHKHLAPLSEVRALSYARKLTTIRYASDSDRQKKVYSRLGRAASDTSTARLMRSPLQVTIMAELVDKLGQAPQERWSLFKEYFKVIYDREVERDIPAAGVLRQYRSDIEVIHYQTGLLLQLESERTGLTDAKLKTSRFGELVRNHFSNEGHSGADLETLMGKIIGASSHRLVFLVGVEADQVGFEVRSLQEFMAAEGLMQGNDACIRERLRSIAPLTYWRSVFLFAAGKCYVDRKHLRDTIYTTCSELNEGEADERLRVICAGSQLALDLLEDGTARSQPRHYQALARLACRLLDMPPEEIHVRIASLYSAELDIVYQEEIKKRLADVNPSHRASAWTCVVQLASVAAWALELLEGATEEDLSRVLEACGIASFSERLFPVLRKAISDFSPTTKNRTAMQKLYQTGAMGRAPWAKVVYEIVASSLVENKATARLLSKDGTGALDVLFVPIRPNWMHGLLTLPNPARTWLPYIRTAEFLSNPSPTSLGMALKEFGEQSVDMPSSMGLPWPVSLCILACDTKPELLQLAQRVTNGELGVETDWLAAEARWRSGTSLQEMFVSQKGAPPFDSSISVYGFPTTIVSILLFGKGYVRNFDQILESVQSIPDVRGRGDAACWILRTFRIFTSPIPPKILEELLSLAGDSTWSVDLSIINRFPSLEESTIEAIDHLGLTGKLSFGINADTLSFDRINLIAKIYNRDCTKLGLLRVISVAFPETPMPELDVPTRTAVESLSGEFRVAALNLRFASGKFQSEDVIDFASLILSPDLSRRQRISFLDSTMGALLKTSETEKADGAIVRMMDLLKTVPESSPRLMRTLNAIIRRRRSNLSDREVCAKLELASIFSDAN